MNTSNPLSIMLSSIMVTIIGLKVKDDCYYCFLALFIGGLILFIFALVKYWKRYNG